MDKRNTSAIRGRGGGSAAGGAACSTMLAERGVEQRLKILTLKNLDTLFVRYKLMHKKILKDELSTMSNKNKRAHKQKRTTYNHFEPSMELLDNCNSDDFCRMMYWLMELYEAEELKKRFDAKIIWTSVDKKEMAQLRSVLVIWTKEIINANPHFFITTSVQNLSYIFSNAQGERFLNFFSDITIYMLYLVANKQGARKSLPLLRETPQAPNPLLLPSKSHAIFQPNYTSRDPKDLEAMKKETQEKNKKALTLQKEHDKFQSDIEAVRKNIVEEDEARKENYAALSKETEEFFKEYSALFPSNSLELLDQQESITLDYLRSTDPLDFKLDIPEGPLLKSLKDQHLTLSESLKDSLPKTKELLGKLNFLFDYLKNLSSFKPKVLNIEELCSKDSACNSTSTFEKFKFNLKTLNEITNKIKCDKRFGSEFEEILKKLQEYEKKCEDIKEQLNEWDYTKSNKNVDFQINALNLEMADVNWGNMLKKELGSAGKEEEVDNLITGINNMFTGLLDILPDIEVKANTEIGAGEGESFQDSSSTINATQLYESFLEKFEKQIPADLSKEFEMSFKNTLVESPKTPKTPKGNETGGIRAPLASSTPQSKDEEIDMRIDEDMEITDEAFSVSFVSDVQSSGLFDVSRPSFKEENDTLNEK